MIMVIDARGEKSMIRFFAFLNLTLEHPGLIRANFKFALKFSTTQQVTKCGIVQYYRRLLVHVLVQIII